MGNDEGRTPAVTVVIPTRDRLSMLQEAVASVLAQTFTDVELIVVDDASTDGTWGWLSSEPRVTALRFEEHSERGRARNVGLEHVRSEYVLFLDDDDRLTPTGIERLVAALRRYPDAGAAVGAFVMFDEQGNRMRAPHPRTERRHGAWEDVVFGWVANPSRTLMRTDTVRAIGSFREDLTFAEDRELCLRLTRHAPIALVPDVVVEYRLHAGQWQPAHGLEAVDEVIENHAAILRPEERVRFARVREARAMQQRGVDALDELRHVDAARRFAAAIGTRPSLARSPLTRRHLVPPLVKSAAYVLLGKRGVLGVRRSVAYLRRQARRDVMSSRAPLGDRPTGEGQP